MSLLPSISLTTTSAPSIEQSTNAVQMDYSSHAMEMYVDAEGFRSFGHMKF